MMLASCESIVILLIFDKPLFYDHCKCQLLTQILSFWSWSKTSNHHPVDTNIDIFLIEYPVCDRSLGLTVCIRKSIRLLLWSLISILVHMNHQYPFGASWNSIFLFMNMKKSRECWENP